MFPVVLRACVPPLLTACRPFPLDSPLHCGTCGIPVCVYAHAEAQFINHLCVDTAAHAAAAHHSQLQIMPAAARGHSPRPIRNMPRLISGRLSWNRPIPIHPQILDGDHSQFGHWPSPANRAPATVNVPEDWRDLVPGAVGQWLLW